jgi:CRP-like cAMP-binding protein
VRSVQLAETDRLDKPTLMIIPWGLTSILSGRKHNRDDLGMQASSYVNQVLSSLSSEDLSLLLPLEPVELRQGEYVVRAGRAVEHVLFPRSGVISLIVNMGDGGAVEVGMIGSEGLVGSAAIAGTNCPINDATVQVAGLAYSIPRARFADAIGRSEALRDKVARVDAVLLAQAQQAAACNASHSAQARVCRWLLELRDRCDTEVLPLTQGFLAHMVGVQRTTVTLVASKLQTADVIRCRRGKVRILDAEKLENAACDCYSRMRELRESLHEGVHPKSDIVMPAVVPTPGGAHLAMKFSAGLSE